MSAFLPASVLRDLTGSPQRERQIAWLREKHWLFEIDGKGYPKVATAYYERRMVGVATTPEPAQTFAPDWEAAGI